MNTYNTELYHFGVKGMRWGVRKQRDNGSRINKSHSKKVNKEKIKSLAKKTLKAGMFAAYIGLSVYGSYKMMNSLLNSPETIDTGRVAVTRYLNSDMKTSSSYYKPKVAFNSHKNYRTALQGTHGSSSSSYSERRGVGQHLGQYRRG